MLRELEARVKVLIQTTMQPVSALREKLGLDHSAIYQYTHWLKGMVTGDPGDSIALAIAVSVGVFLLATVAEFAVAAAGKWLLLGRLKPGRYPLWGLTYFRWWLADRLIEGAPVYMLSGSPLLVWWLRLLGAHIGRTQLGSAGDKRGGVVGDARAI